MKKFIKFLFFVFIFGLLSNSFLVLAEDNKTKKDIKLHNLPIKSKNSKKNQIQLKILPLPLIEVASNSVNSERNPFLGLNKTIEEIGINPKKFFTLTGIIQTGDQLSAMLKSSDGLNLFKEGEYINKELKIKKISLENETVIFTNGENEFKLKFLEK
tara:strand:- start:28 stop:498 length:471 start_codon:yes stop_codon:yes gene_type:complete